MAQAKPNFEVTSLAQTTLSILIGRLMAGPVIAKSKALADKPNTQAVALENE